MAQEDLQEFSIRPEPESIAATVENEGTNASRFAIAGALTAARVGSSDEIVWPVDSTMLDRFGFRASSLRRFRERRQESYEALYEEARYFIERSHQWQSDSARTEVWMDLALEGQLRGRLMFLATGLCSSLERESAAAAVALLGVLREGGGQADTGPRDLRFFWRPHRRSWWLGRWDVLTAGFPEQESLDPIAWNGPYWNDSTSEVVAEALRFAEPRELLGVLRWLAMIRVQEARRSPDDVVREIAFAARLPGNDAEPEPIPLAFPPQRSKADHLTSTMIHGTWGWKGDWWYPDGDFHSFIKRQFRPRLYSEGMEFSWSGSYSRNQRSIAGQRFARWAGGYSPIDGLGTIFAHSYGGEIAARAINTGTRVKELVLLSAPINRHHLAALDRLVRVIDIRLDFDIVLALARERQRLPSHRNVVEYVVPKTYWKHSVTHAPEFWKVEKISAHVGL